MLLLLSFSFSIVHAFVIEANEIEHCSVQRVCAGVFTIK